MAADQSLGFGCKLFYSTDGVSYTELADLEMMGPPNDRKLNMVEKTPLAPTNRTSEFMAGLFTECRFSFKQKWNKTRQALLQTGYAAATTYYWRYCFNDHATPASASKYEWTGPLTLWRPDGAERQKPIHIDAEVCAVGDITWTTGS